ncbi:MAG: hypothetical protein UMU76_03405 [Prosthecochloris sp.]|nr:hypothetical protein [Prosthecochloris sp.]
MSRLRHACMIGRHRTTVAVIDHGRASGTPVITNCRSVAAGTDQLRSTGWEQGMKKITRLLKKTGTTNVDIVFEPPMTFPVHTVLARDISPEACSAQCRIEAAALFDDPDTYSWELFACNTPAAHSELQKNLILFFHSRTVMQIRKHLQNTVDITSCSHAVAPCIRLSALLDTRLMILECEPEHVFLSISSGGKPDYFGYWPLHDRQDAQYFALHELQNSGTPTGSEIYVSGTLIHEEKDLAEKLEKQSGCRLLPFDPVRLCSLQGKLRRGDTPETQKAVSAALTAF